MRRVRFAGIRLLVNRLQAHAPQQAQYPLGIDPMPFRAQQHRQLTVAQKRMCRVQLIQPPHQRGVRRIRFTLPVIEAGAVQRQQPTLPPDTDAGMLFLQQAKAFRLTQRPSLPDKKSSSTFSRPISSYVSA